MVIENLNARITKTDETIKPLHARIEQLTHHLKAIDNYDRQVKAMIASDTRLIEAWDNFAVAYQMIADDKLLRRARDKIEAEGRGNRCQSCNQVIDSEFGRWNP